MIGWLLAVTRLVTLFPVFCLISLLLLIDGLPPLFLQTRVDCKGEPLTLLKFSSMYSKPTGLQVTASGDSRVTPLGKILRCCKLDELQQLWNVLRAHQTPAQSGLPAKAEFLV